MNKTLRLTLFLLFSSLTAQMALGADLAAFLSVELEVERGLLAEDIRLFSVARAAQKSALARFATALAAVDAKVEGQTVSVAEFEALEAAVAWAEVAAGSTSTLAGEARRRLYGRLRRTAALENRIEALSSDFGVRIDPLSGRWRLELEPDAQPGWVEFRFSANLVTGVYRLDEGGGGSLRGTYSGGRLRLERVDSLRGFDAIWEGEVDVVSRRIQGTWVATELSGGGPARGDWLAVKIETSAVEPGVTSSP